MLRDGQPEALHARAGDPAHPQAHSPYVPPRSDHPTREEFELALLPEDAQTLPKLRLARRRLVRDAVALDIDLKKLNLILDAGGKCQQHKLQGLQSDVIEEKEQEGSCSDEEEEEEAVKMVTRLRDSALWEETGSSFWRHVAEGKDSHHDDTNHERGKMPAIVSDVLDLLTALSDNEAWMARGFWTERVVAAMVPLFILVGGVNCVNTLRPLMQSAGKCALGPLCDVMADASRPARLEALAVVNAIITTRPSLQSHLLPNEADEEYDLYDITDDDIGQMHHFYAPLLDPDDGDVKRVRDAMCAGINSPLTSLFTNVKFFNTLKQVAVAYPQHAKIITYEVAREAWVCMHRVVEGYDAFDFEQWLLDVSWGLAAIATQPGMDSRPFVKLMDVEVADVSPDAPPIERFRQLKWGYFNTIVASSDVIDFQHAFRQCHCTDGCTAFFLQCTKSRQEKEMNLVRGFVKKARQDAADEDRRERAVVGFEIAISKVNAEVKLYPPNEHEIPKVSVRYGDLLVKLRILLARLLFLKKSSRDAHDLYHRVITYGEWGPITESFMPPLLADALLGRSEAALRLCRTKEAKADAERVARAPNIASKDDAAGRSSSLV